MLLQQMAGDVALTEKSTAAELSLASAATGESASVTAEASESAAAGDGGEAAPEQDGSSKRDARAGEASPSAAPQQRSSRRGRAHHRFYKTRLCPHFFGLRKGEVVVLPGGTVAGPTAGGGRGGCGGEACKYAHSLAELQPSIDLTKTKRCALFDAGQCPLSAKDCVFAHGPKDQRKAAVCLTPEARQQLAGRRGGLPPESAAAAAGSPTVAPFPKQVQVATFIPARPRGASDHGSALESGRKTTGGGEQPPDAAEGQPGKPAARGGRPPASGSRAFADGSLQPPSSVGARSPRTGSSSAGGEAMELGEAATPSSGAAPSAEAGSKPRGRQGKHGKQAGAAVAGRACAQQPPRAEQQFFGGEQQVGRGAMATDSPWQQTWQSQILQPRLHNSPSTHHERGSSSTIPYEPGSKGSWGGGGGGNGGFVPRTASSPVVPPHHARAGSRKQQQAAMSLKTPPQKMTPLEEVSGTRKLAGVAGSPRGAGRPQLCAAAAPGRLRGVHYYDNTSFATMTAAGAAWGNPSRVSSVGALDARLNRRHHSHYSRLPPAAGGSPAFGEDLGFSTSVYLRQQRQQFTPGAYFKETCSETSPRAATGYLSAAHVSDATPHRRGGAGEVDTPELHWGGSGGLVAGLADSAAALEFGSSAGGLGDLHSGRSDARDDRRRLGLGVSLQQPVSPARAHASERKRSAVHSGESNLVEELLQMSRREATHLADRVVLPSASSRDTDAETAVALMSPQSGGGCLLAEAADFSPEAAATAASLEGLASWLFQAVSSPQQATTNQQATEAAAESRANSWGSWLGSLESGCAGVDSGGSENLVAVSSSYTTSAAHAPTPTGAAAGAECCPLPSIIDNPSSFKWSGSGPPLYSATATSSLDAAAHSTLNNDDTTHTLDCYRQLLGMDLVESEPEDDEATTTNTVVVVPGDSVAASMPPRRQPAGWEPAAPARPPFQHLAPSAPSGDLRKFGLQAEPRPAGASVAGLVEGAVGTGAAGGPKMAPLSPSKESPQRAAAGPPRSSQAPVRVGHSYAAGAGGEGAAAAATAAATPLFPIHTDEACRGEEGGRSRYEAALGAE